MYFAVAEKIGSILKNQWLAKHLVAIVFSNFFCFFNFQLLQFFNNYSCQFSNNYLQNP